MGGPGKRTRRQLDESWIGGIVELPSGSGGFVVAWIEPAGEDLLSTAVVDEEETDDALIELFKQAVRVRGGRPARILVESGHQADLLTDVVGKDVAFDIGLDESSTGMLLFCAAAAEIADNISHAPKLDGDEEILTLHVSLDGIEPQIWRRVQVPATLSLQDLHPVLQVAMGWDDTHLHEWVLGKRHFGDLASEEVPADLENEAEAVLADLAEPTTELKYIYDFGDEWSHTIVVERSTPAQAGNPIVRCTAGARACPPEDCGGPGGYQELVEALSSESHPRHKELKTWVGSYDPEDLDLEGVNIALATLFVLSDESDAEDEGELFYNPDQAPEPALWMALNEEQRYGHVHAFHEHHDPELKGDSLEAHVATHLFVEDQLATNDPPAVRRALDRLQADGLPRHDAIHAIGGVLVNLFAGQSGEAELDVAVYEQTLDDLRATDWIARRN